MISGKDIRKTFKKCELIYNCYSHDSMVQELMLKLVLLDLCGWIETSFDQIYYSSGKSVEEKELIQSKIEKCYSFKYKQFKEVLCFCIGVHNFKIIESKFSPQDLQLFHSSLSDLCQKRDTIAHNNHSTSSSTQYLGINDLKIKFLILLKAINLIEKEIKNLI